MFYHVVAAALCLFVLTITANILISSKTRSKFLSRVRGSSHTLESYNAPHSLSPAKQGLPTNAPTTSYGNIFPPHRRAVLASCLTKTESVLQASTTEELDYSKVQSDKEMVGDDEYITATGFRLSEVRALGDFPDYATLSGVPLPAPYHDFDIKTALPRPYRPLRWAYHQTMCKCRWELQSRF